MTMTPKKLLTGVRDLLSVPGQWHQGDLANDAEGNMEAPDHRNAVCWCLMGAFIKVGAYHEIKSYREARKALMGHLDMKDENFSIIGWNDNPKRTQDQVVAALDQAILLVEKLEPIHE